MQGDPAKGHAFAPWPDDKIELLRAHAPRPIYWAAMLALYTGQRRGDVLRMMWGESRGRGHAQVGGWRGVRMKCERPLEFAKHGPKLQNNTVY
jgi:hypothetical protein